MRQQVGQRRLVELGGKLDGRAGGRGEGEDAVEGGAGYVFTRGVNAKDAALVLPGLAMHG